VLLIYFYLRAGIYSSFLLKLADSPSCSSKLYIVSTPPSLRPPPSTSTSTSISLSRGAGSAFISIQHQYETVLKLILKTILLLNRLLNIESGLRIHRALTW